MKEIRLAGKRTALDPCARCHWREFSYAPFIGPFLAESAKPTPSFFAGRLSRDRMDTAFASAGSGLGIFSISHHVHNVVQDIPYNPLLLCNGCRAYSIVCPNCETQIILDGRPRLASLVQCSSCRIKFGISERSEQFDRILGCAD
jgi:hypothetical protein